MSLYAIGDLHLHYQSVLKAPGQLRGRITGWDEEAEVHAKKLVERDLQRLRKSFAAFAIAAFIRILLSKMFG